ncbi:MAG: UDP-3-O-(3-hydroxymyristoyl)glucosamine N-acyltransferase [Methylophilaceae bacterium 17-44-8]|jgi:UDP-3-O-[3-hydroxymyristoyl] glucosamine N-acyltransferase|nr:MAG: UDP-3-O-(3-hydroxymyristoyl)glucosamine N-acyltransferase [Methylophilaceae bacterium 17-44-8]
MLTIATIVDSLGGEISGDATTNIHRVGSLAFAQAGAISFFMDTKYSSALAQTQASAVVLTPQHANLTALPKILTDNPYAYFAKISALLNPVILPAVGIHASAIIGEGSSIDPSASIGCHAVIGDRVRVAAGVIIGAGCVIEQDVIIAESTQLEPNVTVKHGTQIGKSCHLFSGCVIGNDGFGYAEDNGRWVKIPQVGRVVIGDYVDIGANTTIDRGAIDDTVIEEGVKLDNLIQIAHNCHIGAHTVIAGCVGIAGSAKIGKHCKIGGAAMILGHLSIADHVTISPGSMIMRSIRQSGTYTALMPFQEHETWLKTAANIRHLNQLTDKIKALEDAIHQLSPKAE